MVEYKDRSGVADLEKTHALRRVKRRVFLLFLGLCLLTAFLVFLLNYYLYCLQRVERIEKIDDYTSYTISYHKQNRCQVKEKFRYDGYTYYYDCLENVYLNYGSTQMTLEEAITGEYLSLSRFIANLKVEYQDEQVVYTKLPSSITEGYKVIITDNNDVVIKAV